MLADTEPLSLPAGRDPSLKNPCEGVTDACQELHVEKAHFAFKWAENNEQIPTIDLKAVSTKDLDWVEKIWSWSWTWKDMKQNSAIR